MISLAPLMGVTRVVSVPVAVPAAAGLHGHSVVSLSEDDNVI